MRWSILMCITALTLVYLGCGPREANSPPVVSETPEKGAPAPRNDEDDPAKLTKTRSSRDSALVAEIAKLDGQKGTPRLFDAEAIAPSDERSTHARIAALFAKMAIEREADQLGDLLPINEFRLNPTALADAKRRLREHETARLFVRRLLAQPPGPLLAMSDAASRDWTFLDGWRFVQRLELLVAAQALAADKPLDAATALDAASAIAERLAREPSVTARACAARMRFDASMAWQATLDHPKSDRTVVAKLAEIADRARKAMRPEREVWQGERVAGLVVFERVRRGELLSLLSGDEIERMKGENRYEASKKSIVRNVDHDERFFLTAIGRLLDGCEGDPREAAAAFSETAALVANQSQGADFPYVSATMLLTDFVAAHKLCVQDAGLVEAWRLALESAVTNRPPPSRINPAAGKPFEVTMTNEAVEVRGVVVGDRTVTIRAPRGK